MNFKNSEKTLILTVVLILISAFCAGLIALVYGLTKNRIEYLKIQTKIEAAKLVMPSTSVKVTEETKNDISYFVGKNAQDEPISYAFTTESTAGYSGPIKILFGIDVNCKITGFKILEMSETPGLGDQADKDKFKTQFIGKALNNFNFMVTKDGGEVDAITAATITSRAVTSAIKEGLNQVLEIITCNKETPNVE